MAGLSQENLLKDVFNSRVVKNLSTGIKAHYPAFRKAAFEKTCLKAFPAQSFLERCHHLRDSLKEFLPNNYPKSIEILIATLADDVDPGKTDWDRFYIMSLTAYVSKFGQEHYDVSMHALYEFTKRFSAENDLRTFLDVDYKKTMQILHDWTQDPNVHVRRLVSEGTRPRLPMTGRIPRFQKDPRPVIQLLEKLKDDPELYVRRSVANNINDIAKDNPELALATLQKWKRLKSPDVQWVVKHAARSLIKTGDPEIMQLLGADPAVKIKVRDFKQHPGKQNLKLGESIQLQFQIESQSKIEEFLIIDYVIHYIKANGKPAPRVFKMRELELDAGESRQIKKKHTFKNTSGRKHYSGEHKIEIQINGRRLARLKIQLKA